MTAGTPRWEMRGGCPAAYDLTYSLGLTVPRTAELLGTPVDTVEKTRRPGRPGCATDYSASWPAIPTVVFFAPSGFAAYVSPLNSGAASVPVR